MSEFEEKPVDGGFWFCCGLAVGAALFFCVWLVVELTSSVTEIPSSAKCDVGQVVVYAKGELPEWYCALPPEATR